jgi:hypothetical protein
VKSDRYWTGGQPWCPHYTSDVNEVAGKLQCRCVCGAVRYESLDGSDHLDDKSARGDKAGGGGIMTNFRYIAPTRCQHARQRIGVLKQQTWQICELCDTPLHCLGPATPSEPVSVDRGVIAERCGSCAGGSLSTG